MKTLIILGSSRKDGDTKRMAEVLVAHAGWDILDLNDYRIGYYDYAHLNQGDDYLPLMRRIIAEYDVFIFATPVYWYAMSGIMKVFFDRITDLLDEEKELGRKLRTKSCAVLACSLGGNLGDMFWAPFRESANYLGMKYLGDLHTHARHDEYENLKAFADRIDAAAVAP